MVFTTYLQLSIPISIQNVSEFEEIETKLLTALASIWKTLSSIDQHTVILSWSPKIEDICVFSGLRNSCQNPLKSQLTIDTLNYNKWDGLQRIQR